MSPRVLLDTRLSNWGQNPYIWLLGQAPSRRYQALGFTWTRAIFGSYDVFHAHWPEYLVRHPLRVRRCIQRLLALALLTRLRLTRTGVTRTVHNLTPHDSGSNFERWYLASLDRLVDSRVFLTEPPPETGVATDPADSLIPHASYLPWLDARVRKDGLTPDSRAPDRTAPQLLAFGQIKRYKGLETAIQAITADPETQISLRIAGSPGSIDYLRELTAIANGDDRIIFQPRRLDDEEICRQILSASSVLVTYPSLYNSGVVWMALSLNRPVILIESPVARDLAIEMGEDFVRIVPRDFTAADLASASVYLDRETLFPPQRTWEATWDMHARHYRRLTKSHGRRGKATRQ